MNGDRILSLEEWLAELNSQVDGQNEGGETTETNYHGGSESGNVNDCQDPPRCRDSESCKFEAEGADEIRSDDCEGGDGRESERN